MVLADIHSAIVVSGRKKGAGKSKLVLAVFLNTGVFPFFSEQLEGIRGYVFYYFLWIIRLPDDKVSICR